MKNKSWINLLAICLLSLNSFGQSDSEILLTIGEEKVTRAEFERIYLKNNQMVSEIDKKTLEEYLDLFVVYKLKVAEAKAQGLDKTESFSSELEGYRKQLVQPYLTDVETENFLYQQAYERMKLEVNATHILIAIPEKATPEDTLLLYDKTLKIRDRIISGESFEVVARGTSDDPSVSRNGGNLGYFTVFQMVYPFENAAYTTPIGEISMPIRTRFGYHIVKVNERRPASGQMRAAHLMIAFPPKATPQQKAEAKERIDSIYQLALRNEDFATLARTYSQDPGTAKNGGELPIFGRGRLIPELENAAFSLEKDGMVSSPVETQFGYHIVKRIEKKEVGSYEEMLPEIKSKMSRNERMLVSQNAFISNLKERYGFSMDSTTLKRMESLLDESYFAGNWQIPSNINTSLTLFSLAEKKYTLADLARKAFESQKRQNPIPISIIVSRLFNELVDEVILAYQEVRMLEENQELSYLLKEYYDGILLFEIMDRSVWTKAANDTEGLTDFYEKNTNHYQWDQRVHTLLFTSTDEKVIKDAHKLALSKKGKQLSKEQFIKQYTKGDIQMLEVKEYAAIPEQIHPKNYQGWNNKISPIEKENGLFFFHKYIQTIENEPKPLNEVRGQLIADYQEYLEKEWIKELRKKYKVDVNQELFNAISKSLN